MSPLIQAGITVFAVAVVVGAAVIVVRARERRFRRAHAELSELKRRMHEGLALSSMSMFTVGRDGIIGSFVGRRVPDTRLSMTTCVGLPAQELLRMWPEWWDATLSAQRGTASTLLVEIGDVALEVACGPIRDDAAQTTGALITVRDNTEGHSDHERAERLAEVRSTALAVINHKLRGQLNGMLGITDLLLRGTQGNDSSAGADGARAHEEEWLKLAATSGHQLLGFLQHLIELMELEAGRMELVDAPFSLRDQLDELVGAQRERAEAERTTLALRYPLALSEHFIGAGAHVRELIELLLGVALGTNAGGQVTLNVDERRGDLDQSVMVVSVEDRGRGLSAEALGRIFDGLDSPSAMWTTRSGGTGLELAVAKLMAGALGGELRVESAKGVGTTLCLELPLERTAVVFPTRAGASGASRSDEEAAALRVLLVDDSRIQQQVAVSLLEQLGHTTTVVSNGAEALEALDRGEFDVMITELHMPVTDGFEAAAAIRGREDAVATLPILAATSDTRWLMRTRAMEAGMDGFVEKPLELDRLRVHLLRLQETKRATAGEPGNEVDVLDREAIERLEALDPSGEAALLQELLTAFLAATPRQLLQIRDAALALDVAQLEGPLSSVMASCRLLGAHRMQRACERLQRAVESGELLAARSSSDALMAEFSGLRRALPSVSSSQAA